MGIRPGDAHPHLPIRLHHPEEGHGFGLHSSALAAQEMGGSLVAHSDGPGKGATFTLELPMSEPETHMSELMDTRSGSSSLTTPRTSTRTSAACCAPERVGSRDELEAWRRRSSAGPPAPAPARPARPSSWTRPSRARRASPGCARRRSAGRPYALVFLDYRMPPGLNGSETLQRLREVAPSLPVVLCSAFSDYSWEEMHPLLRRVPALDGAAQALRHARGPATGEPAHRGLSRRAASRSRARSQVEMAPPNASGRSRKAKWPLSTST